MHKNCTHQWKPDFDHSGFTITRYKCHSCGIWGYRNWGGDRDAPHPIRAYAGPRTEPDPIWLGSAKSEPNMPNPDRIDKKYEDPGHKDFFSPERPTPQRLEREFKRRLRGE